MNRSDAARYARWSAILALALAGLTGAVYVHRLWVARRETKNAPAPLPQGEEKRFTSLSFKKVEANRTIFVVEASKSTDFKGQDISLLEDVKITVFGKSGDRNDVIHTQSCRYAKADGSIQCDGSVQIDLQSASDAARTTKNPEIKPNVLHVETTGVTFERATGRAQTVQPVKFTFPNGSGEGVGADYESGEGLLRLVRDVKVQIQPAPSASNKKGTTLNDPVLLSGSSLELGKNTHLVQLFGPASAATSTQNLTAGEFTLLLDAALHPQTLIAAPGTLHQIPKLVGHGVGGNSDLQAEKLTAHLSPQGWISQVNAEGKVEGHSPQGTLIADTGELQMWPQVNQAKLLTLTGAVHLNSKDPKSGLTRLLTTRALQMNFSVGKPGEPSRLLHSETLDRGTIEWQDDASSHSKLSANKLALDFSDRGKAQLLNLTGAVQSERQLPGHPPQTTSASSGVVQLSPTGDWTQIILRGDVHLQEADRKAEAQQALFLRSSQTAVLSGSAIVRDATSETRAPKITFLQYTGEMEAEGPVRTTDLSVKSSSLQFSAASANISADHLRANTKSGRAFYTGHARLWQGPSVLEADSIELLRPTRVLNAIGNVRAVFPQSAAAGVPPSSTPVWHVSSGLLSYFDSEDRAHLEKEVVVQSGDQRMRAPQLELYFSRQTPTPPGTSSNAQISRAIGTGGVIVEQGDRRGSAERGVYTAAEQKFVLSGGNPTLFDPVEGTTTGRELTFYRADDTIVVDSGNGLRTITKHRVQ